MKIGMRAAVKLILAVYLSVFITFTFAESGPQEVGTFKRSDSTIVRVMEEDIDGVFAFIGFACWFELPDGKHIAVPRNAFGEVGSCIVRTLDATAEIYTFPFFPFPNRLFPIASRVLVFDGYQFVDGTTLGKRWFSPLIHTSHYFAGYLISVAIFSPFLFLGVALIRKTPTRGWWFVLRAIWFISGALMAGIYGMLMSVYGPYSPSVFLIILTSSVMLYRIARKYIGNLHFGFAKHKINKL